MFAILMNLSRRKVLENLIRSSAIIWEQEVYEASIMYCSWIILFISIDKIRSCIKNIVYICRQCNIYRYIIKWYTSYLRTPPNTLKPIFSVIISSILSNWPSILWWISNLIAGFKTSPFATTLSKYTLFNRYCDTDTTFKHLPVRYQLFVTPYATHTILN